MITVATSPAATAPPTMNRSANALLTPCALMIPRAPGTQRDVRDADVETLKGEGVEQRREGRHQHCDQPHRAGAAPSAGMSYDRHKFSTSVVRRPSLRSETTPMISAQLLGFSCRSAFAELLLFRMEDRRGVGDRPISSGYRNDAMRIDTGGVSICRGQSTCPGDGSDIAGTELDGREASHRT